MSIIRESVQYSRMQSPARGTPSYRRMVLSCNKYQPSSIPQKFLPPITTKNFVNKYTRNRSLNNTIESQSISRKILISNQLNSTNNALSYRLLFI